MVYIRVTYKEKLILLVEDKELSEKMNKFIFKFESSVRDVTLKNNKIEVIRKAKELVLKNDEAFAMLDNRMFLFFPMGSKFIIYLD